MDYWCDASWLTSLSPTSSSGHRHRLVEENASDCFWLIPIPHQHLWFWWRWLEGILPNMWWKNLKRTIRQNQEKNQKKVKWWNKGPENPSLYTNNKNIGKNSQNPFFSELQKLTKTLQQFEKYLFGWLSLGWS